MSMEAVARRVRAARDAQQTGPVEITVAEAEEFVAAYDRGRRHDVYEEPGTGRRFGTQRPPMPSPKVGDEGQVFGFPCVVVEELSLDRAGHDGPCCYSCEEDRESGDLLPDDLDGACCCEGWRARFDTP